MDIYAQIVEKIISGQEAIIGPVAVEQAQRIPHLKIDWPNHVIEVDGNEAQVIDTLIEVYKELFGQISVEVSKESAASLLNQISPEQRPKALQ